MNILHRLVPVAPEEMCNMLTIQLRYKHLSTNAALEKREQSRVETHRQTRLGSVPFDGFQVGPIVDSTPKNDDFNSFTAFDHRDPSLRPVVPVGVPRQFDLSCQGEGTLSSNRGLLLSAAKDYTDEDDDGVV